MWHTKKEQFIRLLFFLCASRTYIDILSKPPFGKGRLQDTLTNVQRSIIVLLSAGGEFEARAAYRAIDTTLVEGLATANKR